MEIFNQRCQDKTFCEMHLELESTDVKDRAVKSILSEHLCAALKFSANYYSTSHQWPSPEAINQNYMKEGRYTGLLLNTLRHLV